MFTRPYFILFAAAVVAAFASAGCKQSAAKPPASAARPAPALPAVVVNPDWLAQHLSDPRLILIDARPPEKYAAGHLPGAVNISDKLLLDPAADRSRNIAGVDKIQRLFGEAGVDMNDAVVVYDDGDNYRPAARLFLVLEVHGHPAAAVLNGGYALWTQDRRPTQTAPARRAPTRFVANLHPERLATKLTVARAIDDKRFVLLDARSPEEYAGLKSDAGRAGHIPGALGIFAQQNVSDGGSGVCQLKYSDDLVKVYAALPADRKIITYCNSGTRASVNYLALRSLGRDVAVYDGAWLEWAGDASLPIETAAPATSAIDPGK
ncbi:MAG: Rhodanese-like thiosulfate sulfurtransferase [Frankiales bacterium]|nr:Rhodanese-like thiosulfate sulfurtransferase [Frankiales bacterium]